MSNDTATKPPVHSATLPPGTYVVGDPCYSIDNDRWMEWLEAADYMNEDHDHILAASLDGHLAVAVGTDYGDGQYEDNLGNSFPVDAGLIGLVPLAIATKNDVGDERVLVTLNTETEVGIREDGIITLGPHEIDTDPNYCNDCNDTMEKGSHRYLCEFCEEEQERQAAACPDCGADYGQEYDGEVCWSCGLNAPEDDDEDDEDD